MFAFSTKVTVFFPAVNADVTGQAFVRDVRSNVEPSSIVQP